MTDVHLTPATSANPSGPSRRQAVTALAVAGSLTALAACAPGVLHPAGPVAAGERTILFNALAIMMLIDLGLLRPWQARAKRWRQDAP